MEESRALLEAMCIDSEKNNIIDIDRYMHYDIKRGLRNRDGTGVLAGITHIGNVLGYYVQDGERYPMPGKLYYRGIDVEELIASFIHEKRIRSWRFAHKGGLARFRRSEEYQELPRFPRT